MADFDIAPSSKRIMARKSLCNGMREKLSSQRDSRSKPAASIDQLYYREGRNGNRRRLLSEKCLALSNEK